MTSKHLGTKTTTSNDTHFHILKLEKKFKLANEGDVRSYILYEK